MSTWVLTPTTARDTTVIGGFGSYDEAGEAAVRLGVVAPHRPMQVIAPAKNSRTPASPTTPPG